MELVAYVDESYREQDGGGFYVLAAAVFAAVDVEPARTAMLALRGGRRVSKVHWNQMDGRDRREAVTAVVGLPGAHVVAVGSPVPPRRQERARALTLRRLTFELHARQVGRVWVESRQARLDRRDVEVVVAARHDLPRAARRVEVCHCRGGDEPLLWVADIVAGAIRAHRQGVAEYRNVLGGCVEVIDLDC